MTMEAVEEKGLQRVGGMGLAAFEPRDFGELERLARYCKASGLFKVASFEAALVVMLTGASLGLPVVAALRGIHVIEGKSVLSSDLLVAVVLKSGQCLRWTPVEVSDKRCVIETHRRGSADPVRHEWTAAMAAAAGLTGKSTWKQYPAAMLRARCSAELARIVYPDVMFGVYAEGEIEAEGELISVTRIDDAPAEPAAPSALDAFRAALTETADLAGFACVYRDHGDVLGGTAAKDVNAAVVARAKACGYYLTADEAHALCGGTLGEDLATAYEELAAIGRDADDESGDGVIAAVVRVVRRYASRPKAVKVRIYNVAGHTAQGLNVGDVKQRMDAALKPPPPPPTGTDGPARESSDPAAAIGATVAANAQHGAQASAEPRVVLDDEHRRPTPHKPELWQLDDAAMRAHIAGKGSRTEIERAAHCHGEHQGEAFLALCAAQLVALDRAYQRRVHGVDAAMTPMQARMVVDRCALNGRWAREAKAAAMAQAA